ncbi:F0F1 ATP synthase subunit gamma [Crocosphaera sp. XPORK-15E]|uniref:F0F1 ATP synthase subunit gamma n=1 Tax=Crocosphaera sp. XPORK-15E TaxID=3110247 RepID=UPI002B2089D2|nr:F0F1 ATP synthase subunit gamma [Crocosphaera sp. XPORK-15E]MEA5534980.1 F0F1 ATP synthase subunit gamma [Crocosphaera sp. XPORK-15E]
MPNLETFKRKIDTAADLQSVVKTMKALAAVSIRQYQKAVISLESYDKTLEMGLQILLKVAPEVLLGNGNLVTQKQQLAVVVFGSDQGMCGQFNEKIANYTLETLEKQGIMISNCTLLTIGLRLSDRLENLGYPSERMLTVPSSIEGITTTIQETVLILEQWRQERHINQILVFNNDFISGSNYYPRDLQIFPLNINRLNALKQQPWPSHCLPTFTMSPESLASALFKQHFFVSLYRASAESLASENASRLALMQVAEKNIKDRLLELQKEFQHHRQSDITEEMLDIISGFEALNKSTK